MAPAVVADRRGLAVATKPVRWLYDAALKA